MKLQIKPSLKAVILSASLVGVLTPTLNAASILWQTPSTISGASDVNTSGTLYGSWAPGDDYYSASTYVVNGVTFETYGTAGVNFGISGAGINMDRYNGFANPNTTDANYNSLLQVAVFNWNAGSSSMIVSWNNMTVGNTYLIEAWLNDGRPGQGGSSTFTGGVNTSAPVFIGNGAPGQYILGSFVADSAAQSFTMSPGIMLNLLQVRDITPVPEPSTLALFAAGSGLMLCAYRRKYSVN
jgi:hypothetical protein